MALSQGKPTETMSFQDPESSNYWRASRIASKKNLLHVWERLDKYTQCWIIATVEAEETLERAYNRLTENKEDKD